MRADQVAALADTPPYHKTIGGELPLDRWIGFAVKVLRDAGIATYESCQGGPGHAFPEPTVRFGGSQSEALRGVAAALDYGLPVRDLRQCWTIGGGALVDGPFWEITFGPRTQLIRRQKEAERDGMLEVVE